MMCAARQESRHRCGSVIVIVLWTIAVAAIITSSVQLFSHRQATLGRESLERIQARWAARAGLENTLEVMTEHTRKPYPDDAKAMVRDMYGVSLGDTLNAGYTIMHHVDGRDFGGPMDEHSKINLNRADERGMLLVFDDMTLDIIEAIGDWMDQDNEVSAMGVERDYYRNLESPYEPRNGPLQSVGEFELIAGIWPKYFRGEDWNLNARLDPNENDGRRTFPPDTADEVLDAGWSQHLTVYSVAGGATASGEPRILLKEATVEELQERLGIDTQQAEALIQFGSTETNVLADLLFSPLTQSGAESASNPNQDQSGGRQQQQQQQPQPGSGVTPLTDEQLRAVLAETCIEDPLDRVPGKINLNSVSHRFFRDMIALMGYDEVIADEILYLRDGRPQGLVSIVDLRKIPNITNEELQAIVRRFDVVSNVYTIASRGRSWASGTEVEIIAVVDRSTIPVKILEYREQ